MYKILSLNLILLIILFTGCTSKIEKQLIPVKKPTVKQKTSVIPSQKILVEQELDLPQSSLPKEISFIKTKKPVEARIKKKDTQKLKDKKIPKKKFTQKKVKVKQSKKVIVKKKKIVKSKKITKERTDLKADKKIDKTKEKHQASTATEINTRVKEEKKKTIVKEFSVEETEKQNLEEFNSKIKEDRVKEIMSEISSSPKASPEILSPPSENIEKQTSARVDELIRELNARNNSSEEKITYVNSEDMIKLNIEISAEKKQKKRIQEIVSQLNGFPQPRAEIEVSQDDLDKRKNARVNELITQMNSMRELKEEKTVKTPVLEQKRELNKVIVLKPIKNKKLQVSDKDLYNAKKTIGDKVCRDASGLLNFVCIDFIAYVEDVKEDKIKVRIVDTQCKNSKYNGIGLYKNTILWDEHYHWKLCD